MDDIIRKIRELNSIFNQSAMIFTPIDALCDQMCNIIGCNIYVFDTEGHILAYSVAEKFVCPYTDGSLAEHRLPSYYLELFYSNCSTLTGQYEENPFCTYLDVGRCVFRDRFYSLYPIYSNFKKSAGMLLIRYGEDFSESDNVLCEYAGAIISLEMMRREQSRIQQEAMEISAARLAVSMLTYSERRAVTALLDHLPNDEGNIFLNAVAAESYSTQSTVTGALKKLEGAGVIKTKSQGVKGKHVAIRNPHLRSELLSAASE